MRPAPIGRVFLGADLLDPWGADVGGGEVVVVTRPGPRRRDDGSASEDGAAVFAVGPAHAVLCVADGLGGHGGGDVASALVLEQLASRLQAPDLAPEGLPSAILDGIEATNRALVERPGAAATTVLVVAVGTGSFRCYHAGDSELLVVGQRGRIKYQTVSHSPVGYAVQAGLLDPQEGFLHEDRHLVSNFVGMTAMHVEVSSEVAFAPRDTLVLGSDGLWDNLYVAEVADLVRKGPLEAAARRLCETAARRMAGGDPGVAGKPDDLTVVLFRARR